MQRLQSELGECRLELKKINLRSLLQAKDSLKAHSFDAMLSYSGIEMKQAEIEDLRSLVDNLSTAGCTLSDFGNFFAGFKIPQIGKEFDLLRFGVDFILNIELKSTSTDEKIRKQLLRNKYYLSFLKLKVCCLTYVSSTNIFYFLNASGDIETKKIASVVELLRAQKPVYINSIDSLFNPSDYLISPFNATQRFLDREYFLTQQQEAIKGEIVTQFAAFTGVNFISIQGSAGTGKTLLSYDIAAEARKIGKNVLIVHCGNLNDGHLKLISSGWAIIAAKSLKYHALERYDLIVVDESQRIYVTQFDEIIAKVTESKSHCIFSHDKSQTLAKFEKANDLSGKILSIPAVLQFKLSEKVRTNAELANFVKLLFSNKKSVTTGGNRNIEITYFSSIVEANNFLVSISTQDWHVLKFTPSQYDKEYHEDYSGGARGTSHEVIGQEFEGVVVTIDRFFSYDAHGDLVYTGKAYYDPVRMLFQNITRARKKLNVVIVNNEEILNRCLSILQ